MIISSQDIRNILKPYDGWFNKVSNSQAILDTHYEEVGPADFRKFSNKALDEIVGIIKRKDPAKYEDLTRSTLYTQFRREIGDCDNWTRWYIAMFKLHWFLDESKEYEPSLFLTVIPYGEGTHAVAGFYYKDRVETFDPQINEWILYKKILAVA